MDPLMTESMSKPTKKQDITQEIKDRTNCRNKA